MPTTPLSTTPLSPSPGSATHCPHEDCSYDLQSLRAQRATLQKQATLLSQQIASIESRIRIREINHNRLHRPQPPVRILIAGISKNLSERDANIVASALRGALPGQLVVEPGAKRNSPATVWQIIPAEQA